MGRYSIDVPTALVPARVAAILEQAYPLHELRAKARSRGDIEAHETLLALHAVAVQYVTELEADVVASRIGSALDTRSEVGAASTSMNLMGASEVARAAGVTTRAVTLAAQHGRLAGQTVGGRWWFQPAAVAAWLATRAA